VLGWGNTPLGGLQARLLEQRLRRQLGVALQLAAQAGDLGLGLAQALGQGGAVRRPRSVVHRELGHSVYSVVRRVLQHLVQAWRIHREISSGSVHVSQLMKLQNGAAPAPGRTVEERVVLQHRPQVPVVVKKDLGGRLGAGRGPQRRDLVRRPFLRAGLVPTSHRKRQRTVMASRGLFWRRLPWTAGS